MRHCCRFWHIAGNSSAFQRKGAVLSHCHATAIPTGPTVAAGDLAGSIHAVFTGHRRGVLYCQIASIRNRDYRTGLLIAVNVVAVQINRDVRVISRNANTLI